MASINRIGSPAKAGVFGAPALAWSMSSNADDVGAKSAIDAFKNDPVVPHYVTDHPDDEFDYSFEAMPVKKGRYGVAGCSLHQRVSTTVTRLTANAPSRTFSGLVRTTVPPLAEPTVEFITLNASPQPASRWIWPARN